MSKHPRYTRLIALTVGALLTSAVATSAFGFVRQLNGKSIDEFRDNFAGLSYF